MYMLLLFCYVICRFACFLFKSFLRFVYLDEFVLFHILYFDG